MHSILIEESKWQQTGFFFYACFIHTQFHNFYHRYVNFRWYLIQVSPFLADDKWTQISGRCLAPAGLTPYASVLEKQTFSQQKETPR